MSIKTAVDKNKAMIIVDCISLSKENAAEFKEVTLELLKEGIEHLSIDLSRTEYIDSSGIGKLLFFNKKLLASGGSVKITGITKKLFLFISSLAIDKVMDIVNPDE